MGDSNGYVAQNHLVIFDGIWVSKAIYSQLAATAADFARSGFSFHIAPPGGGYRWADMQTAMRNDYLAHKYQQAPYYLSPPPSPIPGVAGTSRHGYGLAVDVTTNATVAVRNAVMARNGWHLWSTSDPNHFEPNGVNVLASPPESAFAGDGSTPIDNTVQEDDDMLYYRASSTSSYIFQGWTYVEEPDGILRALSAQDTQDLQFAKPDTKFIDFSGDDLLAKARRQGLREFTGNVASGPLGLTGRIIGRNAKADGSQDYGNDGRSFPAVAGVATASAPAQTFPTKGTFQITG